MDKCLLAPQSFVPSAAIHFTWYWIQKYYQNCCRIYSFENLVECLPLKNFGAESYVDNSFNTQITLFSFFWCQKEPPRFDLNTDINAIHIWTLYDGKFWAWAGTVFENLYRYLLLIISTDYQDFFLLTLM